MYSVNTNISSLTAQKSLNGSNSSLNKAMERLSTGLRINNASDDAAGLAIAERLKGQVKGMSQANRNAQDGISLLQTAEGSLGVQSDILQRMRELSIQASNGTNSDTDKTSIQAEITQLTAELDHIAGNSSFNGIQLLDGSATTVKLHISEKASDTMDITLTKATSAELLGGALDVEGDAAGAITAIDEALDKVSTARSTLGAAQNRLGFVTDNLATAQINTEASLSRIQDSDMSAESSNLAKAEILSQATMAMLARSNTQQQNVLSLLRG